MRIEVVLQQIVQGWCTGAVFNTLKLDRGSFCSFALNRWAVFGLLQLSHFHTPTHAYTLTRVSGLECESE